MTLTSGLVFRKNHVQSISLILFKVGIPNLVGGCSLRWLLFDVGIPNLVC